MILVRTPLDELFNYSECREEYETHRDVFEDEFDWLMNNSYFYSFYKSNGEFLGCIFYYILFGKLTVNAFATRGHHKLNMECFEKSLSWFDNDIYAIPESKTAKYCLIKAGFEPIEDATLDNLYIRRKQ